MTLDVIQFGSLPCAIASWSIIIYIIIAYKILEFEEKFLGDSI